MDNRHIPTARSVLVLILILLTTPLLGRSVIDSSRSNSGANLDYLSNEPAIEIGTDILVEDDAPGVYYGALSWSAVGEDGTRGYYGLQSEGGTPNGRHIHLTIWDPPSGGARAKVIDRADDVKAKPDSSEGNAVICTWEYNWLPNHLYKFYIHITHQGIVTLYDSYFLDYTSNELKHIATIEYPSSNTYIQSVTSFLEYFQNVPSCANVPYSSVKYGNAYKILQDGTTTPLCKARYSPEGSYCIERNGIVSDDYIKLEDGIGAFEMTTPGAILDICSNVNDDFTDLVKNVQSVSAVGVSAPGVPGSIKILNNAVTPIITSDDDSSPPYASVAVASRFGRGRVVALGHDGFFINNGIDLFDNREFERNIVNWLGKTTSKKKMLVTTGHGEWWVDTEELSQFYADLSGLGYTIEKYPGIITPSTLSGSSVVLINSAWSDFSQSEIDAMRDYVSNGGSLFLWGLGWSWVQYKGPLDNYPMNKMGSPFGIRWEDGYISDPSHSYQQQPIFHVIYPDT